MTSILSFDRRLLAAAALVVASCGTGDGKNESQPAVAAPVEVVAQSTLPETRVTTGSVRAVTISPLAAKVIGNVTRVLVTEGQRVHAGDLLLEIDAREGLARNAQAIAAGSEVDDAIAAANAAVSAAEANAALAVSTFERFAALRDRGSVSGQEFDEVAARRAAAVAQLDQARKSRDALVARRGAARASRSEAETFLSYFQVRAPIDGVVTARNVDPGAQAGPGMTLLVVEDDSRSRVETTVDETIAARIHRGDAVTIVDGEKSITARITAFVPSIDPSTRSALVKIDLPAGSGLRNGSLVRVAFPLGSRSGVTVPAAAVNRRGSLTSVLVVGNDGRPQMRLVTLGEAFGGRVEVLSGLDPGETIVARVRGERPRVHS